MEIKHEIHMILWSYNLLPHLSGGDLDNILEEITKLKNGGFNPKLKVDEQITLTFNDTAIVLEVHAIHLYNKIGYTFKLLEPTSLKEDLKTKYDYSYDDDGFYIDEDQIFSDNVLNVVG